MTAATSGDAKQIACNAETACKAEDKTVCATATVTYKTLTGAKEGATDCSAADAKCPDATTDVTFCALEATCTAGKVGETPVSCGGGSGLVIGLVVAGVVLVGGGLGFYCYKKNSAGG